MSKKLAIIGSVGVPANYGGFETLADFLTQHIACDLQTTVYCSSNAYPKPRPKTYFGARLKYIPLNANGIQSIPYDIIALIHALFYADVLLVLGVAGSFTFPFIRLFTRKRIIVNIDGLEHKRAKWNGGARRYLKLSERIAVKYAHVVIADNTAIQHYVQSEYGKKAVMIAYGGSHITKEALTPETKKTYNLPDTYAFKVCRIEPENNIHIILEAFQGQSQNIVIVGNWQNSSYGRNLFATYSQLPNYRLLNSIYNQQLLNQIRSNCTVYIHGHSAGGTNPSLVEAMHLKLPVVAFDVSYNRYTTNGHAWFFTGLSDLTNIIERGFVSLNNNAMVAEAYKYSEENYSWESIATKYKGLME